MSLFADERPVVSQITYDPTVLPTGSGTTGVPDGTVWYDATQKALKSQMNGNIIAPVSSIVVNNTPVTATNPSAAANLMTATIPASSLNVVGKTLSIWAAGAYTTAGGQTPTFTLTVLLGGITPLTFTSTATTASVTKIWNLDAVLSVVSTGATATLECHGIFSVELGAGAAGSVAETSFNDTVIAVSSTVDLTASQTLKLQGLFSSSNAGNSIVQRQFIVELEN